MFQRPMQPLAITRLILTDSIKLTRAAFKTCLPWLGMAFILLFLLYSYQTHIQRIHYDALAWTNFLYPFLLLVAALFLVAGTKLTLYQSMYPPRQTLQRNLLLAGKRTLGLFVIAFLVGLLFTVVIGIPLSISIMTQSNTTFLIISGLAIIILLFLIVTLYPWGTVFIVREPNVGQSLKKSFQLTYHNWFYVLGTVALVLLIYVLIALVIFLLTFLITPLTSMIGIEPIVLSNLLQALCYTIAWPWACSVNLLLLESLSLRLQNRSPM